MRITWLGHSCFQIASGKTSLVLDPFSDNAVPGLPPLQAEGDAVYCSHDHRDHGARDKVRLTGRRCKLAVETIDCFHDDQQGALRGKNRIHIVSDGELRAAHLGDLGHIPDEETLEKLHGVDALLVPVGGYYTIDAETANHLCALVEPRVVIPMHYRLGSMGYEEIASLSDFTDLRDDLRIYYANWIDLTAEMTSHTAILSYLPRL